MKFRGTASRHVFILSVLIAIYSCIPPAQAQTAIYSTLIFTNRQTSVSTQNQFFTSAGIEAGVYREGYDVWHFSTGLDLRASYAPNDMFSLIGPRLELLTDKEVLRPYFEFLVGGGTMKNIQGTSVAHMFYEYVGGVDCPMGRIDYRLLELGIGRTPFNNATGIAYTGGNLWEVTASSGVVYRF